ncbi:MAG: proline--tRNA ligase [Acidimicrobiia bacterium]|nr:proline--tRNA ligase [Acidimicrobiia bacterium]
MAQSKLPTQKNDFPGWYQSVIREAQMAENGLAKGSMVIKPWGYAIWEQIQAQVDKRIKLTGHDNFYFPTLAPMSVFGAEADLVEGFAPEVYEVTQSGGRSLEENLFLRPTSEAIIWETYSRWVQSYRDLPLMYNQWANVFRSEKRSRLFLRTSEFLWQEGHTAHETEQEAIKETLTILRDVYLDTVLNKLMMPVIAGRKSESERFPGASETFTMEAMMRDKKSLQAGTSHYLGQKFAKAYGVQFQTHDGSLDNPYATSWGVSTRLIGGIIMTHGDDKGLRLPSAVAPRQVVIVPIYRDDDERSGVLDKSNSIKNELVANGMRVQLDDREEVRPGNKFFEWELKGVPIRIEIGPRDIEEGTVLVSMRAGSTIEPDARGSQKEKVNFESLANRINEMLIQHDQALFDEARDFRDENTIRPKSYDEMKSFLNECGGYAIVPWDGAIASEAQVKSETKATIRCLPVSNKDIDSGIDTGLIPYVHSEDLLDSNGSKMKCLITGNQASEIAIFSQAY